MNFLRAWRFILVMALVAGLSTAAAAQAQKKEKEKDEEGHEQSITRKEMPAAVLAAFAKAYPKANIIGYSKETENNQTTYEIESMEGQLHRDVTYMDDGKLVSVEESIEVAEIPAAVKAAIDKKFPGGKITRAEKVTKGSAIAYEFEIEFKGQTVEIVFDAAGKETKI